MTHLTFFGLSTENLEKRPPAMVDPVLRSVEWLLNELLSDRRIAEKQVQVRFIGRTDLLPTYLTVLIDRLHTATRDNNTYSLAVCAPFGGKWEIVDATRRIAGLVNSRQITVGQIDEALFEKHLATSGMPDIDILIRTAEKRISNFTLWKLAYSEIYFIEKYFQDLTEGDLRNMVGSFSNTERRFGGTSGGHSRETVSKEDDQL